MKFLKNLFLSFKEVFIVLIIQYIILISTIILFGIDKSIILGSILIIIYESIYIYVNIRNTKINFDKCNLFGPFLLGCSLSIVFNMIIISMSLNREVNASFPIVLEVVSSCFVGPIFEEVLFRYKLINKLKEFLSFKYIIIISSILFSICHTNIPSMIFALIIGIVCGYLYLKTNNILVPIIIHVSANTMATLVDKYNLFILILGIILFIISIFIVRKDKR